MNVEAVLSLVERTYGLSPRADWPEIARAAHHELPADASDADLAHHLVGRLTIGETYFLRHASHFDVLARHLAAAGPLARQVVWSAGCASGEEAFSVLVAADRAGVAPGAVQVVGTDVNPAAVARARAATWSAWSFREAPEWLVGRYFEPCPDGFRFARADLAAAVTFEVGPLRERAESMPPGGLAAILFRNVGIYLTHAAIDDLFAAFARALAPGGLLVVAPGDPRPGPPFVATDDPTTSVYRRPRDVSAPVRPPAPPAPRPRPPPPARPAARTAPPAPRDAAPDLADAARLADAGRLAEALAALARAPRSPATALLRSQVQLAAGDAAAAAATLRELLFLEPHHRVARYWYALALEAAGEPTRALGQLRTLLGSS